MHFASTLLSSIFYLLLKPVTCTPYYEPPIRHPEFNRSLRLTNTYVTGDYIANFTHPYGRDPAPFLLAQTKKIHAAGLAAYPHSKNNDGPLDLYGDWVATGQNVPNRVAVANEQRVPLKEGVWDLGLYVRPVTGQNLTYGILESAITALLDSAHGKGDKKFPPVYAKLSFVFEVHDGEWGLVGQGVVTECYQGGWDCFEKFGLDGNR